MTNLAVALVLLAETNYAVVDYHLMGWRYSRELRVEMVRTNAYLGGDMVRRGDCVIIGHRWVTNDIYPDGTNYITTNVFNFRK